MKIIVQSSKYCIDTSSVFRWIRRKLAVISIKFLDSVVFRVILSLPGRVQVRLIKNTRWRGVPVTFLLRIILIGRRDSELATYHPLLFWAFCPQTPTPSPLLRHLTFLISFYFPHHGEFYSLYSQVLWDRCHFTRQYNLYDGWRFDWNFFIR